LLVELFRFSILGHTTIVHSYAVLLVLGAAAAIALGVGLARRDGVAAWDTLSVGLLAVAGGLVGASLLDVVVNLPRYLRDPWPPGMAFYGGLCGGAIGALAFIRRYHLPLGVLADAAAPSLTLGHAVGRLGCLCAGCCYGSVARGWPGLRFSDPRAPAYALSGGVAPLHGVQLYEAGGLLLLGGVLLLLRRCAPLRGRLFGVYLVGYGALRFATEMLRGDPQRGGVGPLSTSQLLAIVSVALAPFVLWPLRRRARSDQNSPR
jgi:phosphatidylglycerol:prolipoprotein diacylglycerol transferase